MSYARFKPVRMASYSSWLFLALNLNFNACSSKRSPGPLRITFAPQAVLLDDPSTYIIQLVGAMG